jgi:hypothetical protein
MARKKQSKRVAHIIRTQVKDGTVKISPGRELAPVTWVGWQIRPGEKYYGVVQRADGTVEQTRLERDDLQAAAEFVTAHKMGMLSRFGDGKRSD